MQDWFKFTGKTINILDETLKEFVYTRDVLDKRTGDIGGYAADETCFETEFSSTNSYFFSGCKIRSMCYIVDCKMKSETTILAVGIVIKNCDMQYAEIFESSLSVGSNSKILRGEKSIFDTHIWGMKEKYFSIYLAPQTELTISGSKLMVRTTKEGPGGKLVLSKNSKARILKSFIALNDKSVCVENGVLKLEQSTIENGEVMIIGCPSKPAKADIFSCSIYGKVHACNIYMLMSTVHGDVYSNQNGKCHIKTSNILNAAKVYVCDDSEELIIQDSNICDNAVVFFSGDAKKVDIVRAYACGDSSLTFTEGKQTIQNVELYNKASIVNSSVFDSNIRGTSVIFNTEISNSTIREDTKIGFCENIEINKRLLKKTIFKNLNIRNRFDFFVFPVVNNRFYYIFASGNMYRLFDDGTDIQFEEISDVEEELRFWVKSAEIAESLHKFAIKGFDTKETRRLSVEFLTDNAFDKRKTEYKDLLEMASRVVNFSILKTIILILFNYRERSEEIKRIEDIINKNTRIDLSKKKVVSEKQQFLFVPRFLVSVLDNKDFKKKFLEQIEKKKTGNLFFV